MLSSLDSIDWDFAGEPGTDGLSGFHWYPARFAEQIPSILIGYLSHPGDTVLDPFCGSGTTLIEAFRLNRRAIGMDLNPVACLVSRAKMNEYSEHELDIFASRIIKDVQKCLTGFSEESFETNLIGIIPETSLLEIQKWFHHGTMLELAAILKMLQEESDERLVTLGRACFSSILRACSSQEKHWGYICDNVRPKTLTYKSAFKYFTKSIHQFITHYRRFEKLAIAQRQNAPAFVRFDEVQIFEGNAISNLTKLPSVSVQLTVTSPPYLNVTDYFDAQRLSNLWLFPEVGNELRSQEIGARYKRYRKDSITPYLEDMTECVHQLVRVLVRGGHCCLVLGESKSHPSYISDVMELLEGIGFFIVDKRVRHIAKKRSLSPRLMTETIVIAQKI